MEYHKIQSVFLRDPATKHKNFLEGCWTLPEFRYLANNEWHGTEKIDGTNVRIYWDADAKKVSFNGRTKDAQMPTFLFEKLTELFPPEKFTSPNSLTLYGEGYGAKIQKGGGDYIPDGCGFILFDVWCGIWLNRNSVAEIAEELGIPVAPTVFSGTLIEAVNFVRDGFDSKLRKSAPEGLVLRPYEELFTRRGERLITKIKVKDFER